MIGKIVVIATIIILALVVGFFALNNYIYQEKQGDGGEVPSDISPVDKTTDEHAELTGYGFIQDVIAQSFPEADREAQKRAYEALSIKAKESMSQKTLGRDLALFVGVQDIPDQGVSVEDLQKPTADTATLIVGMNYSGSERVIKAINMVIEDGVWKVDSLKTLEDYPPEQ